MDFLTDTQIAAVADFLAAQAPHIASAAQRSVATAFVDSYISPKSFVGLEIDCYTLAQYVATAARSVLSAHPELPTEAAQASVASAVLYALDTIRSTPRATAQGGAV